MNLYKKNNRLLLSIMIIIIILFNTNLSLASNNDDNNYYPKRTKWEPAKGTNMNISHYVYYDMNRNGIYDVGDRPLVDFAIKMTRPDGTTVVRRSNLNGFANFTNSMISSPVDVSEPGEYTFELIVPEGWKLTSGNKIQKINYRAGTTERSSIIAEKVPIPVGVIQEPRIDGSIKRKDKNELNFIEVYSISPSNKIKKLDVDENGKFSIFGKYAEEYGEWTIKAIDRKNNKEYMRKVKLDTIPVKMSTILIGEENVQKKSDKKLIDFEDITYSTIQKIPNGVGNVNWYNLIVTDFLLYKGEGYVNNRMSGKYVGYNTSGQPVTISKEEGFDFYGGYFGVAWRNSAEGETLEVKAWRGEELIGEEEFELSALGPFYFDADYRNITKLELKTRHYWQFVTDDILLGVDREIPLQ